MDDESYIFDTQLTPPLSLDVIDEIIAAVVQGFGGEASFGNWFAVDYRARLAMILVQRAQLAVWRDQRIPIVLCRMRVSCTTVMHPVARVC